MSHITGRAFQIDKVRLFLVQPLSEDEYNGKGFYYLASYKLKGTPGSPKTVTVDDPTRSEVVIFNLQTFSQYEVSVQSANAAGISASPAATFTGYSGEGSK
jgi:Fibronectin type III domain